MRNRLKNPNPLNIFGVRSLPVAPPHFQYTELELKYNLETALNHWIEDNLKGRYYVGKSYNEKGNILKVGFEDGKELSFFNLACPHLRYK
jgi:hypothetical protein